MTSPRPAPAHGTSPSTMGGTTPPVELVAPLGTGRTSRVWRARLVDPWDGREAGSEFAVKILREDLTDDEDAIRTLENEAEASRACHHPGLARTRYASFDEPTPPLSPAADRDALGEAATDAAAMRPWILLDLVPGRSLERTPDGVPLTEPQVRAIGARLARALAALHAAGWVHGDVKPENIRLDAEGLAVLVDLGLARRAGSPDAPLGTPAYLAPERAVGAPPTAAADLFALGCVLYELVVGVPAAGEPTNLDRLQRGAVSPPSDIVPRVSPLFDALVLELLSPAPGARPTAGEAAVALEEGESSAWWRARVRRDPAAVQTAPSWTARHGLPLVGREDELEALASAWGEARAAGTSVVLTGERGMGKSRVVTEFVHRTRQVEAEAPVYLYGRCDAVGDDRPGAPLIALLRRWLHLPPDAPPGPRSRALLDAVVPRDVARTLLAMLDPSEESDEGAEMTEAVALGAWILGLAREQPAIVFLDDVNDAGNATLSALLRVAREIDDTRLLLIVGLRRRAEVRHPAALAELRNRLSVNAHRIDLGALEEDDVLALVERVFHHSAPRLRLARTLHERTGGIPGSLVELVQLAAQKGWTRRVRPPGRGLELLVAPEELPRPESLVVAIKDRLDALDPEARIWLERLAVVGGRIDPALVARAWPRASAARREASYAELVRTNWIVASGARYRFAEPVEREETLACMPPKRLTRAHRAVAHALAEEEREAHRVASFRRAFHLRHAEEHCDLLEVLPGLVDRMESSGHPHRRATLAGWGLDALESEPSVDASGHLRRRFLEALADAADRLGEREEQRAALDELGDLAIDLEEEPAAAARIYLLHARHATASGELGLARGMLRNARDLAERAATRAFPSEDAQRLAVDRSEIERLFGQLATEVGDYAAAQRHASLALVLAPDPTARARARLVQAEVEIHQGETESALRRIVATRRELRADATGLEARATRASTSLLSGRAWRLVGWPERAARAFERATELAVQAGEGRIEVEVAARRGRLLADVGREAEAELALRDALFAARRMEDRRGEALASLFLGTLLAERGMDGAHDLVRRSLALSQEMGIARVVALALAIDARIAREAGETRRALEASAQAMDLIERHGAELPDRIVIGATRALVLSETGQRSAGKKILRGLERRIDDDRQRLSSARWAERQRRWTLDLLASASSPDGPLYPRRESAGRAD
ncbi:MAG: AAA family ATPase [Planctomycetota bacterium]